MCCGQPRGSVSKAKVRITATAQISDSSRVRNIITRPNPFANNWKPYYQETGLLKKSPESRGFFYEGYERGLKKRVTRIYHACNLYITFGFTAGVLQGVGK